MQRHSQTRGRAADQRSNQEIMRGPGAVPHKSGTNRTTRRHPMSTSVTPTFPQAIGRPDHQGPGHGSTSRATSANAAQPPPKTGPRRAGRPPGWPAQRQARHGSGGLGVASHQPPEGYHAVPRGQAWQARLRLGGMFAPGAPRGRAMPGRRDATRLPACKINHERPAAARHHDLQHAAARPGDRARIGPDWP
jgi:hypothetical protein